MGRLDRFLELKNHPWLAKVFSKLNAADILLAKSFIERNDSLDRPNFEMAVNRMFMDKDKPKAWKHILELLTICN